MGKNTERLKKRQNARAVQYTHERFPITETINFHPYNDPNFTPSDIGDFGDIEYMQAKYDTLPYYHNYSKPKELRGKSVIVYNDNIGDNNVTNEAIALDAVTHGLREQNPFWRDTYLPAIERAYRGDAEYFANEQGLTGEQRNEFIDGFIDGKIRAALVKDDYREQLNYPSVRQVREEMSPEAYSAMLDAYHYVHPTELPEITVKAPKRIKSDGGSLIKLPQWDELSMREKAAYIGVAVKNGMRDLPAIRRMYNEFAKGGYMPSEEMRKKIAEWEGSSMATNRPFDLEARDFERALPDDIRDKVLSNPQLADYLYSYSYNVGSGNFRKRVVPALRSYYSGDSSVDDITRSMWASGDKKLRGLARRRAWERDGVRDALWNTEMERVSRMIDNSAPTPVFIPTEPEPMVEGFIPVPKDVPEQTVQPSRQEQPKESTGRYMDLQELMTAQDMLRFPIGETTTTAPSASYPTNSPYIVRVHDVGGSLSGDDGQEKRTMLVREKNGHPVSYDEEGYLTDQVTGEKGTMMLQEVTVRPSEYRTAFEPTAFTDYLGKALQPIGEATAAIMPGDTERYLNIASPTQWAETLRTAVKGDVKWPWNEENHGFFSHYYGDDDTMGSGLDLMSDLVVGPKFAKGE